MWCLIFCYSTSSCTLGDGLSGHRLRIPLRTMHQEMGGRELAKAITKPWICLIRFIFLNMITKLWNLLKHWHSLFTFWADLTALHLLKGISMHLKKLLRTTIYESDTFMGAEQHQARLNICCFTSKSTCRDSDTDIS